jgi:copper(I)-binding protein
MSLLRRLLGTAERDGAPAYTVGSLEIRRPWARTASPGASEAAGFFGLANKGDVPDRLLAAESPGASRVEIHAIKVVGGDITMRPLEQGLAVPPNTALTLQPRGYHLMLLGLKAGLAKGSRVPVTLVFEKAGRIAIELGVEDEGPIGNQTLEEKGQPG